MITKCRPIEIARKKFSDFENYEKNENQVFLVGYEIDTDGNKKNVKIDAKDLSFGSGSSNTDTSHKSYLINKLVSGKNDYYEANSLGVNFNLSKCGNFIEIIKVDESLFIECESPEEDDVNDNVKEFIFTVNGETPGKTSIIIIRLKDENGSLFPLNCDTLYFVYDNQIIAEIDKNDVNNNYVYIEIFHTHNSNIVRAVSY